MKKLTLLSSVALGALLLLSSGCARVGNDFNTNNVQEIKIGQTSQADIRAMFGKPWRVGIENGVTQWTYGRYTYRLIGDTDTKDLVVKFKDGKVSAYNFNTTDVD
ncbi:MAG: outer membrane protein assembly factor BamE [Helicobacteraceae bacterium]|nr:outer membrane protein assembly factor BamE [Helicobacteraceae bacterium]